MRIRVEKSCKLLVVTPNMHKVHHSRDQRETDSNYSNIFSIWDRLFGTYTNSTDFRSLSYGLDGFDVKERQTLSGLLKMPFVNYNRTQFLACEAGVSIEPGAQAPGSDRKH